MKKIKVGIFGTGRGFDVAHNFMMLNCDIVAICDFHEERRKNALEKLGSDVAEYTDFDKFLEHDMDAVIIANYFNEHAPFIIKCFEKNIHVFCECISNGTMAEGVELARAFEQTSSIFFLAENYPQMKFNREISRVCKSGKLGKFIYAEGEYNHPHSPDDVEFFKRFTYFDKHWRNYVPRSYYVTHSLGPIMHATGATPERVVAFASFAPVTGAQPVSTNVGDAATFMLTQNDDGSVFKFVACSAYGAHGNSYRVCGENGQIENIRGMGEKVMLRYNHWTIPEGEQEISLYEPRWNDKDEAMIEQSGHGGSDFITARMFLDCIRENRQPEFPFDLHTSVTMSSVAILAHRSMLEGGMPYDIPDFTKEEDRKKYENDRITPFIKYDGSTPDIPCCSHHDHKPTEEQLRLYHELLES